MDTAAKRIKPKPCILLRSLRRPRSLLCAPLARLPSSVPRSSVPPHRELPRVDAVSEAMMALDTDRCPGSIFTALTFRGTPDIAALAQATRHLQQTFPDTVSRLQERRIGLRFQLLRVVERDPPPMEVLSLELHGRSITETLAAHFAERSAKRVDLYTQLPSSFHLVSFSADLHAMVFYFHHVAADGTTALAMFRTLFARYEQILHGKAPEWAQASDLASSAGRQVQPNTQRVLGAMVREGRMHKQHPVIRLGSTAGQKEPKRYQISFTLTETETAAVAHRARALKATVNDLLCVSAARAIDAQLGHPEGTQSIWVPANARGATGENQANQTTSINIDLIRAERQQAGAMLAAFVQRRRHNLEIGRDVVTLRLLERLVAAARLFPARVRQPWMNRLFAQPTTFMVSNLGILWPHKVDGKFTTQSRLTHAGGLEILDFLVDFATFDNTGHEMAAWTFGGRFTAVFSAYEQVMPRAAAERLIALTRGFLVDW